MNVLVVHPDHSAMNALIEVLSPEIELPSWDCALSLGRALGKLVEKDYRLCFIYGLLSEGLDMFLSDMKKAGMDETCSFIQFWDGNAPAPEDDAAMPDGLSAVISLAKPQACKARVMKALEAEFKRQALCVHAADVSDAVKILVKNVDDSVDAAQLGKDTSHDHLIRSFVETKADLDESILDGYIDALIEKAGQPSTLSSRELTIPEDILARNLPKLSKTGYSGTSVRVLRRIRKRFGDSTSDSSKEDAGMDEEPGGED